MGNSINSASFAVGIAATIPVSAGKASGSINVAAASPTTYSVGTGAGKANVVFTATRSVASSGSPDVLDLNTLTDAAGNTVDLAAVSSIIIDNRASSASTLVLGGGTDPVTFFPTAGTLKLEPGGILAKDVPAGMTVTASTAMNLQVGVDTGTSVPYTITILGRNA